MAKVTFGALATTARGKLAGIVYERNQNGFYVRAKGTQTNTATPRRTAVREIWTTLSAAWNNDLDDAQRDAWRRFAEVRAIAREQPAGRNNAGREAFFSINAKLINAGETSVDDPPTTFEAAPLTNLTATMTAGTPGTAEIAFTPASVPADHVITVWATPPANTGRSTFLELLLWLAVYPELTTSPLDITAEYAARFGNITAPNSYGLAASFLNVTNGSRSQRFQTRATTT